MTMFFFAVSEEASLRDMEIKSATALVRREGGSEGCSRKRRIGSGGRKAQRKKYGDALIARFRFLSSREVLTQSKEGGCDSGSERVPAGVSRTDPLVRRRLDALLEENRGIACISARYP